VLDVLFNIAPDWNSDPHFSRLMILIANLFMGYPYMFILSLGMLQSIPKDLYEASSLEGSGPLNNLFRITLPLVTRPMLPLLIASFTFNFNNFVLIQLLTRGDPIIIGSNPQAGETDLLVNYAFRLAFMGDTQDFALGATISTFIFLMVGIMAVIYLKAARIEVGRK
jgi:maltose/maltodextrin transport system permease protein